MSPEEIAEACIMMEVGRDTRCTRSAPDHSNMRQLRSIRILCASTAFAFAAFAGARGQGGRPSLAPGFAYTIRVTGQAGASPVAGPGTNSHVGPVSFAGARGRM